MQIPNSNNLKELYGESDALNNPHFNAITQTGNWYIQNPTIKNGAPCISYGCLIVFKASGLRTLQMYFTDTDGHAYWRIQVDGTTWKSWYKFN